MNNRIRFLLDIVYMFVPPREPLECADLSALSVTLDSTSQKYMSATQKSSSLQAMNRMAGPFL